VTAITQQGIAQANYSIEAEGGLDILASSGEPPASSLTLHFDVVGINPEGLAFQATQTAQALLQTTPSAEAVATPIAEGTSPEEGQTGFIDLFLVILISAFGTLFAYQAGANIGQIRWAIRWALTTLIGGLAVGSYLALDFPGTRTILMFSGEWGVVLFVLLGTGLGWFAGWAWRETSRQQKTKQP
jgi:hypothetical protein